MGTAAYVYAYVESGARRFVEKQKKICTHHTPEVVPLVFLHLLQPAKR